MQHRNLVKDRFENRLEKLEFEISQLYGQNIPQALSRDIRAIRKDLLKFGDHCNLGYVSIESGIKNLDKKIHDGTLAKNNSRLFHHDEQVTPSNGEKDTNPTLKNKMEMG